MKLPDIIGIAGTNASGKDTLGHLRAAVAGAKMVSLSDIMRRELDKQGFSHERENLRALGNRWREESGYGVLAEKTIENYLEEPERKGLTITSVRNPTEVAVIKQHGGIIVWVDADRRVRYDRIMSREIDRVEDKVSFEEFCAQEDKEMKPLPDEPSGLNMEAVRDAADITIINEFSSVEEYKDYLIKEFELS